MSSCVKESKSCWFETDKCCVLPCAVVSCLSCAIKYEIGTLDFPQVVNVPRVLVWRVPLWQCSRHQSSVRPAPGWTCTKLTVAVGASEAIVSRPAERRIFPSKVFPTWAWGITMVVISTPWLRATTPWRQEEIGAVSTGLWRITRCTDRWVTSPPRIAATLNITWRKWSQPKSGWIFPFHWAPILLVFSRNNRAARHGLTLGYFHWTITSLNWEPIAEKE